MKKIALLIAVSMLSFACGNETPVVVDAGRDTGSGDARRDTGGTDYCAAGAGVSLRDPSTTCTQAQFDCIAAATTEAQRTACNASNCLSCLSLRQLLCSGQGTSAPCRSQLTCLLGCLFTECPDSSQSCVTGALMGTCAAVNTAFNTCAEPTFAPGAVCANAGNACVTAGDGGTGDSQVVTDGAAADAGASDSASADASTNG